MIGNIGDSCDHVENSEVRSVVQEFAGSEQGVDSPERCDETDTGQMIVVRMGDCSQHRNMLGSKASIVQSLAMLFTRCSSFLYTRPMT